MAHMEGPGDGDFSNEFMGISSSFASTGGYCVMIFDQTNKSESTKNHDPTFGLHHLRHQMQSDIFWDFEAAKIRILAILVIT